MLQGRRGIALSVKNQRFLPAPPMGEVAARQGWRRGFYNDIERNNIVLNRLPVLVDFVMFFGNILPIQYLRQCKKSSPSTLLGCHLSHREGVLTRRTLSLWGSRHGIRRDREGIITEPGISHQGTMPPSPSLLLHSTKGSLECQYMTAAIIGAFPKFLYLFSTIC